MSSPKFFKKDFKTLYGSAICSKLWVETTMSIFDLVLRIGKHFGLATDQVSKISSSTLNQAAKRPPKTGFDLTKSKRVLGFSPQTFKEDLQRFKLKLM